MPVPKPLFVLGLARGGTTLVARALDAADGVSVASDPYMPLYKLLRDAQLRSAGIAVDAEAPFADHYFSDDAIAALDAIQDAGLDVAVSAAELDAARSALSERLRYEAADLLPFVDRISGATGREVFDAALGAVAEASGAEGYAGTKEVWTVEFAGPLARAFPEARFVLVLRDPRGILASLQALAAADASQAAHPLSYARHWRKAVAFAEFFRANPQIAPRLRVLRYEDLVRSPKSELRSLCDFLGIEFSDRMAAPAWAGNSSYAVSLDGIDPAPAERWREELDPGALAMCELVCGPEMELAGYQPSLGEPAGDAARDHIAQSDGWPVSWRSDSGDPARDYELEVERRELLDGERPDPAAIRRGYLFEQLYDALPARQAGEGTWTQATSTR